VVATSEARGMRRRSRRGKPRDPRARGTRGRRRSRVDAVLSFHSPSRPTAGSPRRRSALVGAHFGHSRTPISRGLQVPVPLSAPGVSRTRGLPSPAAPTLVRFEGSLDMAGLPGGGWSWRLRGGSGEALAASALSRPPRPRAWRAASVVSDPVGGPPRPAASGRTRRCRHAPRSSLMLRSARGGPWPARPGAPLR